MEQLIRMERKGRALCPRPCHQIGPFLKFSRNCYIACCWSLHKKGFIKEYNAVQCSFTVFPNVTEKKERGWDLRSVCTTFCRPNQSRGSWTSLTTYVEPRTWSNKIRGAAAVRSFTFKFLVAGRRPPLLRSSQHKELCSINAAELVISKGRSLGRKQGNGGFENTNNISWP